jgi:hypothetical protein
MLLLDNLLLNADNFAHQLHLLGGVDFLEPTHFLVADLRFERFRLRFLLLFHLPEDLDPDLQTPGELHDGLLPLVFLGPALLAVFE